jgi:hypothetical protein
VRDPTPVRAAWRDGYETQVAQMFVEAGQDCAWWRLEIEDLAPGREARRDLPDSTRSASLFSDSFDVGDPAQEARMQREAFAMLKRAAESDLDEALQWVRAELGDGYVLASQ